ncbi:PREDICTED: uncharacterized protein LOC109463446 [Branchiostoma belcheri]|uniref:Uncharacterized protein LOC109463446 n=1 Tax=Branchiostoma belcheri TaxID=7741 RepID=A0A6P4XH05_BRABE|nr:PREDICTED: uncharacterized protein LOC109463446 [Branchiostoma belcheri]
MAQQTKIFKFLLPMSSNTPIQRQSSSRQASDVPKPSPSPSTSNRRAGSRPPPKPGKPKGLGSPKPRRKRKSESPCESGDGSQVKTRKKGNKENEPSASTQVHKEHPNTGDIMFRLKVALKELHGDFEIRAPGNQPIKDALQADTRLKKINKKLHKIYLQPYGETPPINGEPNIRSPCRVIEGGRFEAKLRGKGKIPKNTNKYTDDQLRCSERYKIYLDVKNRPSMNAKFLTKENPKAFPFDILVDCLPDDTFLTALYRDARIDNNKLKNAKLMCKDSIEEVNIKLTSMCSDYDGKTFTCKVAKDSQVSDQEWNQTVASSPDVALSDTDESYGTPDSQGSGAEIDTSQASDSWKLDPQVVKGAKEMKRKSQKQVAKLLSSISKHEVQFDREEAKPDEEKRRKQRLNKICQPLRQDYNDANQGTEVEFLEKLCKLACSAGILVKNNDRILGTCFRMGSRYVLTNKHVTEIADRSDICAYFNYKRPFRGGQDVGFKVARTVHISSPQGEDIDELDYSLLELEVLPDQSDKLPPGLGHKIERAVKKGTVTIIGHPGGRPKKVDTSCPVLVTNDTFAVCLKYGDAMLNNPKRCNYKSSFDYGSSGSPGFDDDANLVVMHACGYYLHDTSKVEVAQGVRMTAIRDDLKQHLSADVWDDLFLPPTQDMEVGEGN